MQLTPQQFLFIKSRTKSIIPSTEIYLELDSNELQGAYHIDDISFAAAIGVKNEVVSSSGNGFTMLQQFLDTHKGQYVFGYFTYDLKNEIEDLKSNHPNHIGFPEMYFFVPNQLVVIDNKLQVREGMELVTQLLTYGHDYLEGMHLPVTMEHKVSREEYIKKVQAIRQHIIEGDVYELNYCVEFFAENAELDPVHVYQKLKEFSPTPYGCFLKLNHHYLISASPERFINKRGQRVYSQPIKGTIRRSLNEEDDKIQRALLLNSEKERAENLMIVDLVRNDLARSAGTGSVKVDELFGIYSFKFLHQMVSTVSAEVKTNIHPVDIIKNAFPMGSMTGAPKIKAMELIEQYETTKRGLYSGAVGYFSPNGNFDFNVVIRTIQYNQESKYISFETGSAITYDSIPEQEYDECLLKAAALMDILLG